jgi:hypothetical protein
MQETGQAPADAELTQAYADLTLAWGLAQLGEEATGKDMLRRASAVLADRDEAHAILLDAYAFRIRQALEGRPRRGPLPAELLARVERVEPLLLRSKVERLRERMQILEPSERVNAIRGTVLKHHPDELERTLAGLRGLLDREELTDRLNELVLMPPGDARTLPRVLAAALDLAPRLGDAFARPLLERALPVLDRFAFAGPEDEVRVQGEVLDRALFVAAHFDHAETVRHLARRVSQLADAPRPEAKVVLEELVGQSLRGLRRLGLRAESDRLLAAVADHYLPGGNLARAKSRRGAEWPAALPALLQLAAGWFYVGRDGPAGAILDEARATLFAQSLPPERRAPLAIAYVGALGQASVRLALGRIEELFHRLPALPDRASTNTHYGLSALRLVEAVVLAVVNDDFALGPAVRRWLDDDEYVVRRRIHRDVRAAVGGAG